MHVPETDVRGLRLTRQTEGSGSTSTHLRPVRRRRRVVQYDAETLHRLGRSGTQSVRAPFVDLLTRPRGHTP